MVVGSVLAMSVGAGMMAYALNCKKTKKSATRLVNNAMDYANNKISNKN